MPEKQLTLLDMGFESISESNHNSNDIIPLRYDTSNHKMYDEDIKHSESGYEIDELDESPIHSDNLSYDNITNYNTSSGSLYNEATDAISDIDACLSNIDKSMMRSNIKYMNGTNNVWIDKIGKLRKEINEITTENSSMIIKSVDVEKTHIELQTKIKEIDDNTNNIEHEISDINDEIEAKCMQYKSLETDYFEFQQINESDNEINESDNEINDIALKNNKKRNRKQFEFENELECDANVNENATKKMKLMQNESVNEWICMYCKMPNLLDMNHCDLCFKEKSNHQL